mmetsp:Transcript_15035/g.22642  ORF Transcript_15035/g.22642 Transcript_15035/m.22642 type:complete len:84 (+) Transcript_15035:73-324(+)|eukprot:scaffold5129_cov137-Skeletonema_dohrnii-CCMP3373.AAC.13
MSSQACQSARAKVHFFVIEWDDVICVGRQHVLVCGRCVVVLVPKYIDESSKAGARRLFHAIVVGFALHALTIAHFNAFDTQIF